MCRGISNRDRNNKDNSSKENSRFRNPKFKNKGDLKVNNRSRCKTNRRASNVKNNQVNRNNINRKFSNPQDNSNRSNSVRDPGGSNPGRNHSVNHLMETLREWMANAESKRKTGRRPEIVNRVDMKNLFPGKTTLCRRLAVLTLLSLLVLPAYVDGSGGNDPEPGVADIRGNFLAAVNQARSASRICGNTPSGPSPPVAWSDNLAMAAYLHSRDMARKNILSHTGPDGSSAGQRISRQGYPWSKYGENLAAGNQTVSSVIRGWLGSERHCRNLMNPAFTEIGAGYAIGPFGGNPAARYWTFDLADR